MILNFGKVYITYVVSFLLVYGLISLFLTAPSNNPYTILYKMKKEIYKLQKKKIQLINEKQEQEIRLADRMSKILEEKRNQRKNETNIFDPWSFPYPSNYNQIKPKFAYAFVMINSSHFFFLFLILFFKFFIFIFFNF